MFSLALIIIGILFIIFPESSATVICYVVGALMLVFGVVNIITFYNTRNAPHATGFSEGIVLLLVGLLLLIRPEFVANFLTVILGVVILFDGAEQLQKFIFMCKIRQKNRWLLLISSCLALALGLITVLDPFSSRKVLMIFAGVSLIVDGAMGLAVNPVTNRKPPEDKVIDLDDEDIHVN